MTPPDRLRALLAEPGLVVMPAVWDGLTAKLAAGAGFKTAFLSGSCVAASRLGGPDLDLISFGEMFDSFNMVHSAAPDTLVLADGDHGYGNAMNVQRTVRAYGRAGAAAILIEDKITPRALTAGQPRASMRPSLGLRCTWRKARTSCFWILRLMTLKFTAPLPPRLGARHSLSFPQARRVRRRHRAKPLRLASRSGPIRPGCCRRPPPA